MVDRSAVLPLLSGGLSATVGEVADLAEAGGLAGWTVNDSGYLVPTAENTNYPNAQLTGAPDTGSGGGNAVLIGADDAGNGPGIAVLEGGSSNTTGVSGGSAWVRAGGTNVGNADGGLVQISAGGGSGTGNGGGLAIDLGAGAANGILDIENATSTPGVATGTLTNAPKAGNAQTWLAVTINGVEHWMPAWHA